MRRCLYFTVIYLKKEQTFCFYFLSFHFWVTLIFPFHVSSYLSNIQLLFILNLFQSRLNVRVPLEVLLKIMSNSWRFLRFSTIMSPLPRYFTSGSTDEIKFGGFLSLAILLKIYLQVLLWLLLCHSIYLLKNKF